MTFQDDEQRCSWPNTLPPCSTTWQTESRRPRLCMYAGKCDTTYQVAMVSFSPQILSISKHHQKAPYSLILPFFDQVAPFIVQRLPIQPDLLGEACRVMGIATADFIMITLPRTLPELFASCDQKVLDSITKEVSAKPSALLLKHSHKILAHIFLLPTQSLTNKALNFVVKVLIDATGSSIDIQSVVKSCVVPLFAELVVVMGDENEGIARQVSCHFTLCFLR